MKIFQAILLAAALGLPRAYGGFFPDNAFSEDARGLTAAQFLKVPPSARFAALGGCGLALRGPDSFFLNPAGAASGAPVSASASYEALLGGASRTGLVFSRNGSAGVFSAGVLYNDASPGLKLDGAGSGSGEEFAAYDAAAGVGWARSAGWGDFGVNLKYIKSRLAEASGASAALDAGFILKAPPPSRTELALALRNFGPPLKLGSEKAALPSELAGGLRWKYTDFLNIFFEGRLPSDHAPFLALAGEWLLPYAEASGLALRAGFNFKNYSDHGFMGTFSGGFGLRFGGLTLDYAFSPYGDLGAAHRMTAGWAWGGVEAPRARRVAPLPYKASLAVAPFSGEMGVTGTEAEVVRNLVEAELGKTGAFRLVERNRLDFILAEKKLAYAGLAEDKAAAELGRLSGARLAVFGSISRDENGYLVTARLADAATGEILRTGTADAEEDYLFRDAARRLAAALSK